MKALLIVDVQRDFLPGGALEVSEGDQVIPIINALQKHFSCILATKDWHPLHHVSFAATHGKLPGESINIRGKKQELWPPHCIQGTPGAEFACGLNTEKIGKIFYKGIEADLDSYSSFFDNAHERATGLEAYLRQKSVEELFLAGLTTEYCIKYSALDAIQLGFKTHVILNACRGVELKPGNIAQALEEMRSAGVDLLPSYP